MSSNSDFDPRRLDKVIHAPIRLGVVAALYAGGEESFTALKKVVGATDGNLTIHLQTLEQHGMVKMRKSFVGRRPRTTYRLTAKGREAIKGYVACMGQLVDTLTKNDRRQKR